MSEVRLQGALTKARQIVELNGIEMVYFIGYNPTTKQFGSLIGNKTNEADRLVELRDYCIEQLKHLPRNG